MQALQHVFVQQKSATLAASTGCHREGANPKERTHAPSVFCKLLLKVAAGDMQVADWYTVLAAFKGASHLLVVCAPEG